MAETGRIETWLDRNVKVPLTPEQKTGLTSFGFNLGTGALQKLLPDLNAGNFQRVAERMPSFSNYTDPVTGEVHKCALTPRRLREAALVNQTTSTADATPSGGGMAPPPVTRGPDGGGAVASLTQKGTDPNAPVTGGYSR